MSLPDVQLELDVQATSAARVRAAIAYSGRTFEQIAKQTGLGESKLRRIASATNPRGGRLHELHGIADACGVPRAWFEHGEWNDRGPAVMLVELKAGPFGGGTLEERVQLLERYVFALLTLEEERIGGALALPPHPLAPDDSPRARGRKPASPRPKRSTRRLGRGAAGSARDTNERS